MVICVLDQLLLKADEQSDELESGSIEDLELASVV
eukprot:CAMPEP_0185596024 /NCGR_PEP_ID=MMETSP0434-20130131/80324_1 /TAXON_ID=626734 ORGANISM="Favella taraikaensis, Strain Fe Narragansett Bay" /NCGR_SAMPLE_ID=MMETSP0434 /ASSEMBLY_ACC=CAM_ASM_000379 /LENGTH=34 /DNA_ID= /DNA_START= /DNA_END= /DNA_ORIENTATION=